MRRRFDPDAALEEFRGLLDAQTADALHRILVLHPPQRRTADADLPFELFRTHHALEPATSPKTAALLLTDRRWAPGVVQLARRIEQSGLLSAELLDLLARSFVAAGPALFVRVPDDWFAGEALVVHRGDDDLEEGDVESTGTDLDAAETVARREVPPPLRRWAAARLATRDPSCWPSLIDLDSPRDGKARNSLLAGVLDAIAALAPAAQDLVIETAIQRGDAAVRLQAFELMIERIGIAKVAARAAIDPNAKVREWAASLGSTETDRVDQSESTTLF